MHMINVIKKFTDYLCYDDECHLKLYASNEKRKEVGGVGPTDLFHACPHNSIAVFGGYYGFSLLFSCFRDGKKQPMVHLFSSA